MRGYQRQNGDIVELTAAGMEAVKSHKNNYADSTKPLAMEERKWSAWDMGNLWIGMLVSIAVYQVASGLIVSGMSWAEALFTIVLGHFLVMVFAVVLGHFGTKYGLTYPMLCKMVFGSKGTVVPSLVRGILGCFWFGVQAWIGGQAVNAILAVFLPFWNGLGFKGLFISFLIFWLMNVYIAGSGSGAVQKLEKFAAPVLILLSFIVIIWGMYTADWSITGLLSEPSIQGNPDADFWKLFFPALSSMIAFDGGIALSMADFTRNCRTQKAQMVGQLATLFTKKIKKKKAALIAAVLALFAQPWNALASAYDLIYNVCGLLGALLGPISGLYLVSYLFEHKTHVDLVDLYREDGGRYYYKGGWNTAIIAIFLAATAVIIAGKYIAPLHFLFDNAYVIGSVGAGVIYYLYLRTVNVNKKNEVKEEYEDNHQARQDCVTQ